MGQREKKSATPEPSRTKRELVASGLRRAILNGELQRGQHLYETSIAAQFNVSPTPVREALRSLHAEGLVTLLPHRGAVVTRLSAEEVQEVFEMRVVLEPIAAKHAAERVSLEDLTRLQELLAKIEAAEQNPYEFFRLNTQFHSVINKASGRQRLLDVINNLRNVTQSYLWQSAMTERLLKQWQSQHRDILSALEHRDPNKAESIMRQHMLDAAKALEDHLRQLNHSER